MREIHPADAAQHARLSDSCAQRFGGDAESVRLYHAPYRICPLGAHIDHQLGSVSSIATSVGITLAVLPRTDGKLVLASQGFAGTITIDLDGNLARAGDWADYARGAIQALRHRGEIATGLSILVDGELAEAGLSSSAAVGLGYLCAIADAHDVTLTPLELVELDRQIENGFLGLKNGILDPASIALAAAGKLLVLNCETLDFDSVAQTSPFTFLAVYSGVRAPLVGSAKFNNRVDECFVAGGELWALAHGSDASPRPLGCSTHSDWEAYGHQLPQTSRRRASHFFSENQRVISGAKLWQTGDAAGFGALMNESAESSIHAYETGCEELVRLVRILQSCDGVHGARFSGAGFRGCCVALVEPEAVPHVAARTGQDYTSMYPGLADAMWSFATTASEGLRAL